MKPKNFPARKLKRKLIAEGIDITSKGAEQKFEDARQIRTKKKKDSK